MLAGLPTRAENAPNPQAQQDQKTQLEQQLQQIENQISQYQQQLTGIQSQKKSLQRKISSLGIEKASLNLKIQETNLSILGLDAQIQQTQDGIDLDNKKISALKNQMTGILKQLYTLEQVSTVEILLSNNNFSDFFDQLNNYESVDANLAAVVAQVKVQTADLQQKQSLASAQQTQQKNMLAIQGIQSQALSEKTSEQNTLLRQTKGQESNYQALLQDNQKQAAAIRSRIYELFGTNGQVTFGQAADIAKLTSQQTGVSAAFLLAILTQESNLGKNVGTCNRPGDPPAKSWKNVMKPDRDQQPFVEITKELGLNPDTTPVSCPMFRHGRQFGWGGAMGPAQFIPSTWMGYKDQISAITGHLADPWNIKDAFLAAAIKLKADGAGAASGEWDAAMRYFSGSTNVRYRFYGDNVMALTNRYQADINNLGN